MAGTPDADIDTSEPGATADAWQVSTGRTSALVAVVDTGVDIGHPDLAANVWTNPGETPNNGIDDDGNGFVDYVNGWDFAHGDNSVYDPGETCGGSANDDHGTHVASIVGAAGNNGIGVAGVNWRVQIMPLKFLAKVGNQCGVGDDADAIEAILYATRMGAGFINVSWGGAPRSEALRQAFIAAGQRGVFFAAAAGNSGADLSMCTTDPTKCDYPPNFDLDNEIVVAASDHTDALASFSNFGGPTDLAAPGTFILGTITRATDSANTYRSLSGTSMAAPMVTGSLALLRSQFPGDRPSELKARIVSTVDPKAALASPKTQSGGRLNLNRALRQERPVVPTLVSPNGGETFFPRDSSTISWSTNLPSVGSSGYRVEFTADAEASRTLSFDFETGIGAGLSAPPDSDLPWTASPTSPHPGGSGAFSARSGAVGNDRASWLSTTTRFSVPGSVSFWYRVSSENCESAQEPVCGDYLRFFVDGVPLLGLGGKGSPDRSLGRRSRFR